MAGTRDREMIRSRKRCKTNDWWVRPINLYGVAEIIHEQQLAAAAAAPQLVSLTAITLHAKSEPSSLEYATNQKFENLVSIRRRLALYKRGSYLCTNLYKDIRLCKFMHRKRFRIFVHLKCTKKEKYTLITG